MLEILAVEHQAALFQLSGSNKLKAKSVLTVNTKWRPNVFLAGCSNKAFPVLPLDKRVVKIEL